MIIDNGITNDIQLQQVIINDLTHIINEVAGRLLENLQDSIETIVYDAGTPSTYDRNKMDGGLQGSFERLNAKITGLTVESKVEQNPMSMKLDPENYIHGSNDWKMDDVRDILADIITHNELKHMSGPRFGNGFWREPRDFWEPFIKELNKNGSQFIEEAFRNRGIVYTKVS